LEGDRNLADKQRKRSKKRTSSRPVQALMVAMASRENTAWVA
jgi:hypothetical protein